MTQAAFVYTDEFLAYNFNESHPLQQRRLRTTYRLLQELGQFDGTSSEVIAPVSATFDDLATVHSPDYIDAVRSIDEALSDPARGAVSPGFAGRYGLGPGDNPAFPGMWESSLLYVGASLTCVDRILTGSNRASFNSSGGLHHAMRSRAAGFCLFNDCAIVARKLIAAGKRVACLDVLDAHHGDGTQALLYDEPDALTVSFHESGRTLFPGTGFPHEIGGGNGIGCSVNVPMEAGSSDTEYARAYDEVVGPLMSAYKPDVIVLMTGADAHFEDPLAHLALTSHGWMALVSRVIAHDLPIIALGCGGYNLRTVPRLWALLQCALGGRPAPVHVPAAFVGELGPTMHDVGSPTAGRISRSAGEALDVTIRQVREAVFPYHGLAP